MSRTQDYGRGSRDAVPIRRASAADRDALRDFFAGLSVRTRYLRFFAPVTTTPTMLRVLSGDGDHVDAVIATRGGVIVGHAMSADRAGLDGTMLTEIGVVVADEWQGSGVGSALVRALLAAAATRGVTTVAMDVLPGNPQVLAMIAAHWPAPRTEHSADCVTIRAPIPRSKEGRPHAGLARQGRPAPLGTADRARRRPALTAAQLPVGRPFALGGSRP